MSILKIVLGMLLCISTSSCSVQQFAVNTEMQTFQNKESSNMKEQHIKSGWWTSSGNNPFWLEVKNDQVFWLGMNQPTEEFSLGEQWCHVGHGTIKGSKIYLTWSDIPVGKDQLDGTITIEIIDATTMRVVEDSGNFGKSEWTWRSEQKNFNDFLSIDQ